MIKRSKKGILLAWDPYESLNIPDMSDLVARPSSSVVLPEGSLRIVNQSIERSYKNAKLPQLNDKDVVIVDYKAFETYIQNMSQRLLHTVVRPNASSAGINKMREFDAMFCNFNEARNIYLNSKYISSLANANFPQYITKYVVAHMLIHEYFHKVASPKIRNIDSNSDQFWKLGLAQFSSGNQKLSQASSEKSAKQMSDFMTACDPIMMYEGGLIETFGLDSDGFRRKVLSSGYDFNEGLVKFLAVPPRRQLCHLLAQEIGKQEAEDVAEIFQKTSTVSVLQRAFTPEEIKKQISRMGITDQNQLLDIYRVGNIPDTWYKRTKSNYPS